MESFEFINGGIELLDNVKPLWNKLNNYHLEKTISFKKKFTNMTFEVRMNKVINDNNLKVNIDLIKDKIIDSYIGYCMSTVNNDLIGELSSIYIEKDYRKLGLGHELITKSLAWQNENNAKTKIIGVAVGNENALGFYEKYGFYKRTIILERINKELE
ncbi:Acetyltransferase (GNAT) family protein [Clostridium cavendishii DSM 21758]|uniref:Acetyltransferase (GNAT) family protein n=1 Tax=Clostridium cavendishii DSM 21758 TaxID=1121302 RepID=A0A1M6M090_9CLOT|nr:GNAT family N-acetyltransferase [Clostridium cavendishii]SHJ76902.1 Acetyltransferase (GNAT) family protein [Clostridium cavendishii DSM 21758]